MQEKMAIPTLDVFQVIGDPSRRKMLMLLFAGSMNINHLAENFDMSRLPFHSTLKF